MEIILNFFVENYLWFLIISLILIFGLIGYIVDAYEKRTPKLHFGDNDDINEESPINEDKSLKELLEEHDDNDMEKNLNEAVSLPNLTINESLDMLEETKENELPNE